MILLYENVSEWFLSHKFLGPTWTNLIFSGSDILIYWNIFCFANFDVEPHRRRVDFYTKVIVKNLDNFEVFSFSFLGIQKSLLTIKTINTAIRMIHYKIEIRVCQMPFFLKIKSPTGFSYGIYPRDYENAKKNSKT